MKGLRSSPNPVFLLWSRARHVTLTVPLSIHQSEYVRALTNAGVILGLCDITFEWHSILRGDP